MPSAMNTAQANGAGFVPLLAAIRDVYSAEIYFQAMPNMRFDQFATRKTELGQQPGSTIKMPKFNSIKRGGKLVEGQRLQTRAMSMSESSISVDENGNAIGMSERLLQLSFYDNLAAAAMLLGRDMAIVLDLELRNAVRSATTKVYGGGKSSRNALTNADGFSTTLIYKACERLATNSSPKWGGDFYICFIHPRQSSELRQSAGWVNVATYASQGQPIFFGEIGRWNDVRFIETSMMANGVNSSIDATTGDYVDPGYDPLLDKVATPALNADAVFQAVMFGEYSYGHAVALPTELRDNGVQDFGREHALAWYSIWGSGLLEQKNIVVIETGGPLT